MVPTTSAAGELTATVIQEIADATDTPPEHLPRPLHDVIDPDALDALFRERDTEGYVRFCYEDYIVSARSDGTVTVERDTTGSERSKFP